MDVPYPATFTVVALQSRILHRRIGCCELWPNAAKLEALPRGRLLAAELVLDADRDDELAYSFGLQMLVLFGSKERTVEEFQALYDAAGLRLTRVIPTTSMFSLIEGVPVMA
jgi:hypothetical protein